MSTLSKELGADLVLYNGKVVTVDHRNSEEEAVAVRKGRILKVGKSKEIMDLSKKDSIKIDLNGRLLTS